MKTKALILKCLHAFAAVSLFSSICFGQTNIGGVINTYARVSSMSASCSCPSSNCATATVVSAAGFAANDIVLIIQMKGARADSSNTTTHGNILSLNDAGNYEVDTIASIASNVITFKTPLKQTYFTNSTPADSAYVQLVKVPVYSGNVNVTSTLTPAAWNAATGTGGVLAFFLTGTLTLQANISADGLGFATPAHVTLPTTCDMDTAFYYQSTIWNHAACTSCGYAYDDSPTRRVGQASYGGCGTTCFTNRLYVTDNRSAAFRGEGIVASTFKKTFANGNIAYFNKGRGHWGNGGGGGSQHNSGGGGGGNYGSGGFGGNAYNNTTTCTPGTLGNRRGYGGSGLTPTGSKIFMGGAGGEGHDNGGNGSTGANGAGIIIIKAASITNGGSYTITANGASQTFVAFGDGSGGGGAGGTILMDVSGSYTNAVTLQAKGGNGGSHNNNNCHGTGGGGGGGIIWFSSAGGSVPPNTTTNVAGGANGVQVAPTIDCGDINWGATAGGTGGVMAGLASGAAFFLNMNDCSTALPVELVSFRADVVDNTVELHWTMASEIENNYFSVERSENGIEFSEFKRVDGAGNSNITRNYSATDEHPLYGVSYYRLTQVNYDGHSRHSQVASVTIEKTMQLSVYPNPANDRFVLAFEGVKNFNVEIYSTTQTKMFERKGIVGSTSVETTHLPKGIYYVKASSGKFMFVKRLVIM